MRAVLDDPSAVEHEDPVGPLDGREPMRDHDRGPAEHQPSEGLLDEVLALVVERRGRLIEQQDGRVAQ